jgi:hypothetical protein
MKIQLIYILICSSLCFVSCGEAGTTYEQISSIKTISQRVPDLNKSVDEIKKIEDEDALSREERFYIEYDYPIREDEFYVVSYRFNDITCSQIGLGIYLNKPSDAQKIVSAIIEDLSINVNFGRPKNNNDIYQWNDINNFVTIELNVQFIERGVVKVTIFSNMNETIDGVVYLNN